uniref:Uncharacterized protein n=1 Tax=Cuerna arida TaxID=1464854 RepID=A0A1B6FQX8_9HEMI
MDPIGNGYLLSSKEDLDYLGGGHLIKEPIRYSRFMDSLGGGHLLGTKKGLDSLGGGHLIREPLSDNIIMNILGEGYILDTENDLENDLIKDQTVQSRITIKPTKKLFLNAKTDFDFFSKTYPSKYPFESFRKIFEPIRSSSQTPKPCLNFLYENSPINKESKPTKTMSSDSNVYQAKVLSVKITPNKDKISSNPLSYPESKTLSYDFPSEEESLEVTQSEDNFKGVIDVNNLDISHTVT